MLKIGIVGVGGFGHNHARILNGLSSCKLMGLYDMNHVRAKEISKLYNITMFDSLDKLIEKIDALVIVVITTHHYKIAKKALLSGKHVFIEKPITQTFEQSQELIEIANKKNLLIQVGHVERFNPIILKTHNMIKDPLFIEAHRIAPFSLRGTDIPVVQELMIHDIDLILSFISGKVTNIMASGSKVLTDKIDIANARLQFENGAVANITASRISLQRSRKLRIFQKDAYFSIDFQKMETNVVKKVPDFKEKLPMLLLNPNNFDVKNLVDQKTITADDYKKDALTMELESFIDSIIKNKKPLVDGIAGARALKIANEIEKKINKE